MGRENRVSRDLGNFSLGMHGKTFEKRAHKRGKEEARLLKFLLHAAPGKLDNGKIETLKYRSLGYAWRV